MIEWVLHTVKLSDIKRLGHNPRKITSNDFEQLEKSLDKFGLIDRLVCNADLTLIGGHQRLHVLEARKVGKTEVWLPDRLLTHQEVNELCVRLNRNHGEFDFDMLANEFEVGDLIDWGFTADDLGIDIDEKPEKPQKYKIEVEFSSLGELDKAVIEINSVLQDFEHCKMKVKV